MDVVKEITDAIETLNIVDTYDETLASRLSDLDLKQQDILHYIEDNKINVIYCYNIIKKLKEIRLKRRKIKNDMELISTFKEQKAKMTSKQNRQFILVEMHKKEKFLDSEYKYRRYSEEDFAKILRGTHKDEGEE